MIGSRFSGIAVRKSEIAASGPLVPTFEGSQRRPERQTTGLGASKLTISDNGLLCQPQVGFRAELDIGSSRGEGFSLTGCPSIFLGTVSLLNRRLDQSRAWVFVVGIRESQRPKTGRVEDWRGIS